MKPRKVHTVLEDVQSYLGNVWQYMLPNKSGWEIKVG